MNRYGPSIPGLDINRINQFNSDFGDDAAKKQQLQQQLQKQQLLKRQQELKKQEELKRLIEIEKQKKLRTKQQHQQNIQQETQRLYKKGTEQQNLGESIHEMKQMESQIQFERMEQQKEFIKRQQEYKPTNDLISDEFPEGHTNTQKLDDKNDEIELRDSEILNTLMDQQMKKEEKEKVTVTENIDDNQIMLNEGQLNQFKSMVKQWLAYDDEIKVLQNALKDRRAKKNELTPVVMDFMKNHEIEDLNTKDGKLKCYTSNRKKALTQKDIKHKLLGYFKSENKGEKCVEYVFGDREIKEVMNLRRTFKKK